MHMNEVLNVEADPRRYAGWSSCFRREAGSYGKDTRVIIGVHRFDKVEMFSY
jgi:seryl-tRNA synthetase